jgi:HlyD family secretion protein
VNKSSSDVEEAAMNYDPKLLFVIMILSLLLGGCISAEQQAAPTPENGGTSDFGAVISATGLVVPEQWAALSAHSQGVLAEVLVTEGERVAAGQLLMRMDGQDAVQANLSAAQYELFNAQQALDSL